MEIPVVDSKTLDLQEYLAPACSKEKFSRESAHLMKPLIIIQLLSGSRKNAENLKIGNIEETLYYRRIHDKNSGKISRDMARKDLFSILRKSKVGDVYNDRTQN